MRNDPDSIEVAHVVDFENDSPEKQDRANFSGYSCHVCGDNGYFPDALGDRLYNLSKREGTNVHVICEDCDAEYDIRTV